MRYRSLKRSVLLVGCALTVLVGCGSTADVAGEYTIALTNRANGCMFDNWTEGDTTTGVALTVTQNGEAVTASVGGVSGAALDLVLASHEFIGSIDGEHMDLRITGERAASMGACAYTLNADVAADIDGDTLTGTITYRPQTNGASDCNYLNTCSNVQAFNGTRPPR